MRESIEETRFEVQLVSSFGYEDPEPGREAYTTYKHIAYFDSMREVRDWYALYEDGYPDGAFCHLRTVLPAWYIMCRQRFEYQVKEDENNPNSPNYVPF